MPLIPNCMDVNEPSIQICCVTSASSSVFILFFGGFFCHSFPFNCGTLKTKPQNQIDFKFVLSKRRLK